MSAFNVKEEDQINKGTTPNPTKRQHQKWVVGEKGEMGTQEPGESEQLSFCSVRERTHRPPWYPAPLPCLGDIHGPKAAVNFHLENQFVEKPCCEGEG